MDEAQSDMTTFLPFSEDYSYVKLPDGDYDDPVTVSSACPVRCTGGSRPWYESGTKVFVAACVANGVGMLWVVLLRLVTPWALVAVVLSLTVAFIIACYRYVEDRRA